MPDLDGPRWGPKAGGAPHQLVVLCHGVGADGHDLIDLAPGWGPALPHALFASPDAPERYDQAPMGRQWFSIADRTPAKVAAGVAKAAIALDGFIDAELARHKLPAEAYALMGFSQGAMTVLYAGIRRKVPPRAILAYSGALLAPERLAEATARPPILIVHGEADPTVPVERSRLAEAALRDAGFEVDTLYVPRLEHGIDPTGLAFGALFLQRAFADDA
jgi:phospholipase/carboxylesterase